MPDLLIVVVTALVTVLAERLYSVPREVRQNGQRIQNRDEDLLCWLEDRRKQVRGEFIRIWLAEARRTEGPDYSVSQCQKVKDEALHAYRAELRDVERVVQDVALREQVAHRFVRRVSKNPIPALAAPLTKARTLADWETSAEDSRKRAERLRAAAEGRRREAGKPPLRPLRLSEIV